MKLIKKNLNTVFLTAIAILSAILGFVNIGLEGTANSYYAAAIKSMTQSWHNFFFVSFDPSGFVTIDKPPLGFWFQAISAKIFGVNSFGIMLPQILASIGCVILIYFIVKRSFGSTAGLISSFILAITPVFVAVARNNSVDNILLLFLLLACYFLTLACDKGKTKWLLLAFVMVGLGFNVKQLQAYMILPAVYVTFLLTTTFTLKKRIINFVVATVVLVVISFSWATIVDLVPSSQRPYVDSSTNNSEIELILGHNGIERLTGNSGTTSGGQNGQGGQGGQGGGMQTPPNGQSGGMQTPPSGQMQNDSANGQSSSDNSNSNGGAGGFDGQNSQGGPGGQGNQGGPGGQGGQNGQGSSQLSGTFGAQISAGFNRLFMKNILSDQIVWFLVLSFLGFIAAAIKEKLNFKLDTPKKRALVMWFMWLLPVFLFFSFTTGTFHSYYLTMLAPPIAALSGIGLKSMWDMMKEKGYKQWFLPIAMLINSMIELLMLIYFRGSTIITVLTIVFFILSFGGLIAMLLINNSERLKKACCAAVIAGMCLVPLAGSTAVLFVPLNGSFPAAGLELLSGDSQSSMGGLSSQSTSDSLVSFLLKNKTSKQKYLLVVQNSNSAADIIIKTGQPVMSLGGFLGSDNIITLAEFKKLVASGEIRYVMTGGQGGGSSGSDIISWVEKNGKKVSSSKYGNSSSSSSSETSDVNTALAGAPNMNMQGSLYDLKSYTDSLSSK
ncbi:MAG: glycosyltransferase family 39 protein [Bacillota bacterium]|nr:glycosyltransferase family 39 protein [Bacillota bacterium]